MVRKGGETAEFQYGLGISSLQPAEDVANEDRPLRFISVQLQLPHFSKSLDIDIHAFLFEADGTYVDCVFYKNPTLAGRSVRLLQDQQELLVDLRYIPKRCSFIVCTLAIYSGGTVAQLGNGTVQLSALIPRAGLGEGTEFPQLPCGQIPPSSSDFYEWVCLGVLPLKSRSNYGEECGMMLCLLAHHAGFWYFKPVLKPVTAFTPQGLIEPAQSFVTRHIAGLRDQHPGVELGALLSAAREGRQAEFEITDTEGANLLEQVTQETLAVEAQLGAGGEVKIAILTGGDKRGWIADGTLNNCVQGDGAETAEVVARIGTTASGHGRGGQTAKGPKEDDGLGRATRGNRFKLAKHRGGSDVRKALFKPRGALSKAPGEAFHETLANERLEKQHRAVGQSSLSSGTGVVKAGSLFTSYPPTEGYQMEESLSTDAGNGQALGGSAVAQRHFKSSWKESVERRLAALEYSVESIRSDIRTIAAATSEIQRNNKLYVQELRDKFTELKNDVAVDIEAGLSGPLEALTLRVDKLEASERADAKQLAEQQQQLWAVDRMVVLAERNWHLIAQSLSELRFQLAGLEQRNVRPELTVEYTAPPTDQEKGLPVSLSPLTPPSGPRPSQGVAAAGVPETTVENARHTTEGQGQSIFASKALSELCSMQKHAEAFGACLRQLASGTAPDGLKGLNPIERRVLAFAGTPKVFAALHELERAVDAINLHGSGAAGTKLY